MIQEVLPVLGHPEGQAHPENEDNKMYKFKEAFWKQSPANARGEQ